MALCVTGGCKPEAPLPAPAPGSNAGDAPRAGQRLFTDSASRCGECHGPLYEQWKGSRHGQAATAPAYVAMRERARDPECDSCHVPLQGKVDASEPSVAEAITCDGCHGVAEVNPRRGGAGFRLALEDNVKYAELCEDKASTYFHKMACAPVFQDSSFCAGCHLLARAGAGGTPMPLITEYEEWSKSEYARAELPCQGCHMPSAPGQAATGYAIRPQVHQHGFGPLEGHGLKAWISAERKGPLVEVRIRVRNDRGGHALPTGTPGHQLVLRARVVDAAGHALEGGERIYARTLVDSSGHEVPFFEAVRQASDTRLRADETRQESFTLPAPERGRLEVTLLRRELSPALAAALGLPTGEHPLLSSRLPLEARAPLPKNLEMTP